MKTLFIFILSISFFGLTSGFSQVAQVPCAHDEHQMQYFQLYPYMQEVMAAKRSLAMEGGDGPLHITGGGGQVLNHDCWMIPVVFHILHNPGENPGTGANIDYARVLSQMDVLNEEFAGQNSGFNSQIQFCLAQDPWPWLSAPEVAWSNAAEPGVMRYAATDFPNNGFVDELHAFIANVTDVGLDPLVFPFEKYLNVFILPGTTLQFAAGSATSIPATYFDGYQECDGFNFDGVATIHTVIGREVDDINNTWDFIPGFNTGRTLVHEVGHYLALQHPWGSETGLCSGMTDDAADPDWCGQAGDWVCDTPPVSVENYVCDALVNSCIESVNYDALTFNPFLVPAGVNDMHNLIENFMDYTASPCQLMFTQGQIELMQNWLLTERQVLSSVLNLWETGVLSPSGCLTNALSAEFSIPLGNHCTNDFLTFEAVDNPTNTAINFVWDFGDGSPLFTGGSTVTHQYQNAGNFTISLTVTDGTTTMVSDEVLVIQLCGLTDACHNLCNTGFEQNNGLINPVPPIGSGDGGFVGSTCDGNQSPLDCWEVNGCAHIISRLFEPFGGYISWNFDAVFNQAAIPNPIDTWEQSNFNYIPGENHHYLRLSDFQVDGVQQTGGISQQLPATLAAGDYVLKFQYAHNHNLQPADLLNKQIQIHLDPADALCNNLNYNGNYIANPFTLDISVGIPGTASFDWEPVVIPFTVPPGTQLQVVSLSTGMAGVIVNNYFLDIFIDDIAIIPVSLDPISAVSSIGGDNMANICVTNALPNGVPVTIDFDLTFDATVGSNIAPIDLQIEITSDDGPLLTGPYTLAPLFETNSFADFSIIAGPFNAAG